MRTKYPKQSRGSVDEILGFGKFRDRRLSEVPAEFLQRHIDWVRYSADKGHMKIWTRDLPRLVGELERRGDLVPESPEVAE